MRRLTMILGSMLSLAACRGSGPASVEPEGAAGRAGAVPDARPPAFDLEGFEPPFGPVPLDDDFVRAHGLRRVVVHEDANTESAQLVDATVTILDYDREGRRLLAASFDRGEPSAEVRYEYVDGRLAAEHHLLRDGTRLVVRYAYDAAGRVQRIERVLPHATIEEHHAYDARGRPSVQTRIEGERRAERRLVYEGERLQREVLSLPDEGRELVTEYHYDAHARPTRWVRSDGKQSRDVYELAWDDRGRLRSLSFTEGNTLVYRRTYAYDEDGRPLREMRESFVPAMGSGSIVRYEYERHGELPREKATATSAAKGNAELLAAVVTAFGAYEELATVSFEAMGEGHFVPSAVTVFVPEASVSQRSEAELAAQACSARKALGWDCDCERVTLGQAEDLAWHSWPDKRVVPVTLHWGLGC